MGIPFNGNLNEYTCVMPFDSLFITNRGTYACCWGSEMISPSLNIDNVLSSDKLKDLRVSVLDGSFRYCSDRCWYLHNKYGPVIKKTEIDTIENEIVKTAIATSDINAKLPLRYVNNAYDESCNLQCPSCRKFKITHDELVSYRIYKQIEGKTKEILIGGSGDPFYQTYTMRWLTSVVDSDIPNLTFVNIMTNGMLLNERLWSTVSPAIKSKEILLQVSLDGCTKETVEKLRLGANWETLKRNLEFIKKCDDFNNVNYNFVVQNHNYKEIIAFFDFANSMNATPKFSRIRNWNSFSYAEFKEADIFDAEHRNHEDFLKILEHDYFKTNLFINELY